MKITYYECDRCGKHIGKFKDIVMMTLMKKSQEFCKSCSEDFKKWYKSKPSKKTEEEGK